MNRKFLFVILICVIILASCKIQRSLNGFTKMYETSKWEAPLFSLPLVEVLGEYSSSGAFVQLIHSNGRRLDLFVPSKSGSELNIKKVIDIIELENNPNAWDFYYAPHGVINIDSVRNGESVQVYDDYKTIIQQNELYNFESSFKRGYEVRIKFVEAANFCLALTRTRELNNYNSRDKIQDGPNHRISDVPSYLFSNEVKSVRFLMPISTFCK